MNNILRIKIAAGNLLLLSLFHVAAVTAQPAAKDNLQFNRLAQRWDEAMPLGNGMLGAMIWEKDNAMRVSLDRADIWDERPAMDITKLNFKWVREKVLANDYDSVQKFGDEPYDNIVYPTKLPTAAIAFNVASFGTVRSNVLDITRALNTVLFQNGVVFNCYIHAVKQQGFFGFEHLPVSAAQDVFKLISPNLIVPDYTGENKPEDDNSHAGEGLAKLGYAKGFVTKTANSIRYHQPTYKGHYYEVLIGWKKMSADHIVGTWTISNDEPAALPPLDINNAEPTGWNEHESWWKNFWSGSSVTIPDTLLQKQYWQEMYKLGCVARQGAPAITLQAVWTADNGSLPPWKGDFHNDLNTQLSYWPAYTGNHLTEAATYTDWLWKTREDNRQYTKDYFKVDGINVPGVETIHGYPMGGWIQYSLSPTVGAWCAQHFYWQWKYSMDRAFLQTKAYPYIHEVATFMQNVTTLDGGVRKLPLNASPEINDNTIKAWYLHWTNYDLALAKFLFTAAGEVADAAGKPAEAAHWLKLLQQLPVYNVNETGLTIAPGFNLQESHRHLSPYMAIYPLALLDINNADDKPVIENSLQNIAKNGTRNWCGYSFAWMASVYARAYHADSAVRQLQVFASNFCSANSFHLNGDQKGGEYSNFTYRPFTLEGNFAFAQGVHELLLQSRQGYIELFPAIPSTWQNVSFKQLRAEGAFLISAEKKGRHVKAVITSKAGGNCNIKLPFNNVTIANPGKKYTVTGNTLSLGLSKNESVTIEGDY